MVLNNKKYSREIRRDVKIKKHVVFVVLFFETFLFIDTVFLLYTSRIINERTYILRVILRLVVDLHILALSKKNLWPHSIHERIFTKKSSLALSPEKSRNQYTLLKKGFFLPIFTKNSVCVCLVPTCNLPGGSKGRLPRNRFFYLIFACDDIFCQQAAAKIASCSLSSSSL